MLSYNSRGFCASKQEFCRYISSKEVVGNAIPLICNQENFILKGNSSKIVNALPGFYSVIKPAIISSSEKGRSRNGMFIAMPHQFRNQIVDISPCNWRVQAILLQLSSVKILIINSYFPVDPKNNNADYDELLETLQCIRSVISNNDHNTVLWAGDINSDFSRNTRHVQLTKSFIDELNLCKAWDSFAIDFTHYHEVNNFSYVSTIDHFFWDQHLASRIRDCGAIHHPNNLSDHSPIFCLFNLDFQLQGMPNCAPVKPPPKPCWNRSSEDEKLHYRLELSELLTNVEIPRQIAECEDVHCRDTDHIVGIDNFVVDVLESVNNAA